MRDGEGATKFVTLNITGAPDEATARTVARAIATSPLVKTAFYGADPNWGRILAAAGYSGVDLDPARLALWLLDADGHRRDPTGGGRQSHRLRRTGGDHADANAGMGHPA